MDYLIKWSWDNFYPPGKILLWFLPLKIHKNVFQMDWKPIYKTIYIIYIIYIKTKTINIRKMGKCLCDLRAGKIFLKKTNKQTKTKKIHENR